MPERQTDYQDLIVPVIKLISERTGTIRKNAATLLAKLAENPDNKKVMVANHGTEVLVSLKD
jgi:hypothetical protein